MHRAAHRADALPTRCGRSYACASCLRPRCSRSAAARARGGSGQGPARGDERHRHARPAPAAGRVLARRRVGDLRGHVRVVVPRPPARAGAAHRAGEARGLRRRQDVDRPHQAGHLLHRRPGVRRQAARAHRAGLRLLDQAHARSEPPGRRRSGRDRPHRRDARAGRRGPQGRRALRLRRAGGRPARAGPLHAADSSSRPPTIRWRPPC